jgi:hypothetical protein
MGSTSSGTKLPDNDTPEKNHERDRASRMREMLLDVLPELNLCTAVMEFVEPWPLDLFDMAQKSLLMACALGQTPFLDAISLSDGKTIAFTRPGTNHALTVELCLMKSDESVQVVRESKYTTNDMFVGEMWRALGRFDEQEWAVRRAAHMAKTRLDNISHVWSLGKNRFMWKPDFSPDNGLVFDNDGKLVTMWETSPIFGNKEYLTQICQHSQTGDYFAIKQHRSERHRARIAQFSNGEFKEVNCRDDLRVCQLSVLENGGTAAYEHCAVATDETVLVASFPIEKIRRFDHLSLVGEFGHAVARLPRPKWSSVVSDPNAFLSFCAGSFIYITKRFADSVIVLDKGTCRLIQVQKREAQQSTINRLHFSPETGTLLLQAAEPGAPLARFRLKNL